MSGFHSHEVSCAVVWEELCPLLCSLVLDRVQRVVLVEVCVNSNIKRNGTLPAGPPAYSAKNEIVVSITQCIYIHCVNTLILCPGIDLY